MANPQPEGEAGKGELNNAASWDDFPNGRFGDYKSPAYGETDLWGSSILSVSIYSPPPTVAMVLTSATAESSTRTVGAPPDSGRPHDYVPTSSSFQDRYDTILLCSSIA